jgi:hypothetical protein
MRAPGSLFGKSAQLQCPASVTLPISHATDVGSTLARVRDDIACVSPRLFTHLVLPLRKSRGLFSILTPSLTTANQPCSRISRARFGTTSLLQSRSQPQLPQLHTYLAPSLHAALCHLPPFPPPPSTKARGSSNGSAVGVIND